MFGIYTELKSMNSLKRLVWLAFLVVSMMLAAIVLLGAYQYRLAGKYNTVISQNERALFFYMTIRETITESLITNSWKQQAAIINDIEKLNGELNRLKENRLVSAELKLALVDKIDLTGLAMQVRQVAHDTEREEYRKELQAHLRTISDYLIQYDRIIVGQARERIVRFQTVVIGALGLIVSLASISLILLYRNTVSPLLKLATLAREENFSKENLQLAPPVVREITELVEAFEDFVIKGDLKQEMEGSEVDSQELSKVLGDAVNETTNHLNGIINYAQLLLDSLDEEPENQEKREMLQNIIDSGTEIAGNWQNLK